MKNFDFDLCAVPILCLIVFTYFYRRISRYEEYRYFFVMTLISLVCVVLDVVMEFAVNPVPLAPGEVALGHAISFSYKALHNVCLVLYLRFIMAFSRTEYVLDAWWKRVALWAPYGAMLLLLVLNFATGDVFSVTAQQGYERGPMLGVLYVLAALYEVAGVAHLVRFRKMLDFNTWAALLSVYVLCAGAVVVQALYAELMVELFSMTVGLLAVALVVLRPEDTVDASVGVQNWKSFQTDLRNLVLSGQHGDVFVLRLEHASESRNHLGDERYAAHVASLLDSIHAYARATGSQFRAYYEQPEHLYLVVRDLRGNAEEFAKGCLAAAHDHTSEKDRSTMLSTRRALALRVPEDLADIDQIINLCHRFTVLGNQEVVLASDVVGLREFEAWNHVEEILDRAIHTDSLRMHYQPIYDVRERAFRSAEALARIDDPQYGMVSPLVFIPAAERSGAIVALGDAIVEQVFRFMAENDLAALGLSFMEINLSVEQLIQHDLPEKIEGLLRRYDVNPHQVNFEITETVMDQEDAVLQGNLERLGAMGFSFSLDDYGTGYSNVQRLSKMPLRMVKVDKSLTDGLATPAGTAIMRGTIGMMRDIGKQLVVEGMETREALDVLEELSCDYIQGYYFSKPLPAEEFLAFLAQNNQPAGTR